MRMPPALAATVGGLSLAALLIGAIQIARPESGHVSDACSIELHARETCAAAPPESQQVTTDEGVVEYRRGTMLHRIDGPARTWPNGRQEWHQNGRLHRLDGPAMVLPNGMQRWYVDGRLHRADGPAVEMKSGRSWYYLNGRMVSESVLGL